MIDRLAQNPAKGWFQIDLVGGVVLLVCATAATLVIAGIVVVRLPADHFVRDRRATRGSDSRPPTPRLLTRVVRNAAGLALILVGTVLAIPGVPGQGLLTMLVGVMLVDLPGKWR